MSKEKGYEEKKLQFARALSRIPPPVECFSDGACCPWCGALNRTVTFGMNNCIECGKHYAFGYAEWQISKEPISWVPFPWREFEALGGRADVIPEWKPNDRLKEIYFQKTEERLGIYADETAPN